MRENQVKNQRLIFVISGPSGSGKTTLLKNLLKDKDLKNRLTKSISFTTRAKRVGEKEGKEYFFISEAHFKSKIKEKKLLEWTRYLGYYYGTPKDFLKRQSRKTKDIILCLDLKGAFKVKQLYPKNTVLIFVLPPSLKELSSRIKKRCYKIDKEEIKKRLELAKGELRAANRYDYSLINKDLNLTVNKLKGIILEEVAHRSRVH